MLESEKSKNIKQPKADKPANKSARPSAKGKDQPKIDFKFDKPIIGHLPDSKPLELIHFQYLNDKAKQKAGHVNVMGLGTLTKEEIAELSKAFAPDPPAPLTQAEVDQYVHAKGARDEADSIINKLRPKIIAAFQAGFESPSEGVGILSYSEPRHCKHSPDAILKAVLEDIDEIGRKKILTMQADKEGRPEITVKINPKFLRSTNNKLRKY